jgi:tRNA threonylcarbamoyladenosine modification (KEOPS) complex  Pcc1 subunit
MWSGGWRSLKAEVEVKFTFPDRRKAETVFIALKPEVYAARAFKSRVQVRLKDKTLILVFRAPTISSLRASINSFCRWVSQLQKVLELAESKVG